MIPATVIPIAIERCYLSGEYERGRKHCANTATDGKLLVTVLGSTNGTLGNVKYQLPSNQPVNLKADD